MATCKICAQDLFLELDPEDFDEATSSSAGGSSTKVPDDLQTRCGCHFHWQCLLDESPKVALSLACPSCNASIASTVPGPSATNAIYPAESQQPRILTRYHNEGGLQENLDILPLVTEEAYLDANPAARPARAYMTMCGEGDVSGIWELLKGIEEDPDEDDMSPADLLRFQDPLDGLKTGLHVALEKSQQETVFLLLWLASHLPTELFPEELIQAAMAMGAERGTAHGVDIRSLCDEQGRSAFDIATGMGSTWSSLLQAGVLQT
ncbi:hypothetical protein BP6252_13400 [Coleophoma cylindrospora]|uniref:Uncharacterized protein n=1 Tax=Coleophoma cylindrospora TaxID=1849047 RepID=A0A3D8Q858_9HELO|nr:hypothetical protein BP6252_13400 [Coleophoma cylindrospora]